MKALLTVGCCVALTLAPAVSHAQELQWRPARSSAAPAPPASGVVPVTLCRPVPLDDPAPAGVRPIVRAESADDLRPMPPGPPMGSSPPAMLGAPVFTPFTISQVPTPPVMPKAGEFVAPAPQTTAPPTNPWGPPIGTDPLAALTGSCGDPCGTSGASGCCASGWLGNLFKWMHGPARVLSVHVLAVSRPVLQSLRLRQSPAHVDLC